MTEPGPITLAYLAAHPADAARVMDTLEPAELAAFLSTVPVRLAAPPLATVAPWRVARCLAELPAERAAAVLAEMPAERRAPSLRAMPEEAREAILDRMPRLRARALRHQLAYPPSLAGAAMTAGLASVPADATAEQARAAVRGTEPPYPAQVYLVDASGRPAGIVAVARLLDAAGERAARELADTEFVPITAETPLAQLPADRDWNAHPERPVVDARGRLVGSLGLPAVLAARERPASAVTAGPAPAQVVAGAGTASLVGLARALAGLAAAGRGARHER